jgi:hypothetical protein
METNKPVLFLPGNCLLNERIELEMILKDPSTLNILKV